MIAYLTGTPQLIHDQLIIDVNGVGYQVWVTLATKSALNNQRQAQLHIFTHMKESSIELFGFQTFQDKAIFTLLITVSGVGPRTALAILEKGTDQVIHSVQQADVSLFSSVPRVGKKLAQKIIIELKSKLGSMKELDLTPLDPFQQDISSALQTLGFSESDIEAVLKEIDLTNLSLEEAVQLTLKSFKK